MSSESDKSGVSRVFSRAIDRLWGGPAILTALALFVLIVTISSGQLQNTPLAMFLGFTILVGLVLAFVLEYRKLTAGKSTSSTAVETLIAHEMRDSIMAYFDGTSLPQGEMIYSELYSRFQNPVGLEEEESYRLMLTGIGASMQKIQDADARRKVTKFIGAREHSEAGDDTP